MVRLKDKGVVGGIFREDLQWAVNMVGPLDAACSHIVSMWGQIMGTVAIMEGNQLYTSSNIEVVDNKTVCTSD